ncbi:MAG: hypothetical protein JW757_00835 [Anaerolineales bacterium]|nr:hypothetical protein [Anaerolineales bacterium]
MKLRKNLKILSLILLMLTPFLIADVGPKPTADFEIIYQVNPVPELTGYDLYQCSSVDCQDAHRLEEAGPQQFVCHQDACTSMAYGYSEYMYITFDFADGTSLTSNLFTKNHFNAEYQIFVSDTELIVTETGGSNTGNLGPLEGVIIGFSAVLVCGGLLFLGTIILVIVVVLNNKRKKQTEAK